MQEFACHQMTCDHEDYAGAAGLSYLESVDAYEYDTLAIGRMIVQ
jgi:hypothetical protein